MHFRVAGPEDAENLARLNARLIRDEGHRNTMTVSQLAERMAQWLRSEYQAVIFADGATTVGYALFRRDVDHVYLRQFLIKPELRRRVLGVRRLSG